MQTQISSPGAETPTVAGSLQCGAQDRIQRMVGPGYDLPNVTSVMYFFLNYAIHAAYWHDDFGSVASHGW
ncbi:MAG: L,D-transpeptidase [Caldilineaceae bacterium]